MLPLQFDDGVQWKPSFLWFLPIDSSAAMKNSVRLKDFSASGKEKEKEGRKGRQAGK